MAADVDPAGEHPAGHAPPDPEASLPDLQRLERIMGVQLIVGDDVIDAGADQAARHAPHRNGRDGSRLAAPRPPAPIGQPHGSEHAQGNEQPVDP